MYVKFECLRFYRKKKQIFNFIYHDWIPIRSIFSIKLAGFVTLLYIEMLQVHENEDFFYLLCLNLFQFAIFVIQNNN